MKLLNALLLIGVFLALTNSAYSIQCLQCLTDSCVDIIYRIGMTIVECDEGIEECVKLVYSDGRIHRTCALPDVECITNNTLPSTDPTSVSQYCCDHNLCNGAVGNLFGSMSYKKIALLNGFLLITILSIL